MRLFAFSRILSYLAAGAAFFASAAPAWAQLSFFEQIFGLGSPPVQSRPLPRTIDAVRPQTTPIDTEDRDQRASTKSGGATYRTICVRSCDGFFFPISFATTRSNFSADQQKCQASCKDAQLFVYRNPGERIEDAEDLSGRPYTRMPNAFKFRKVVVEQCACRPAPWSEAELKRHNSYAMAEASASGQQVNEMPRSTGTGASTVALSNPLAAAATEQSAQENVASQKAAGDDTPGVENATATVPKPRVTQKASRSGRHRAGVSTTASSTRPHMGNATSSGGALFSMSLGAQPQYVWPGDAPRRR